jgi:hypothetical protein
VPVVLRDLHQRLAATLIEQQIHEPSAVADPPVGPVLA